MNSNYILIEIFCCINSNFDPGNTPNQIYPSLAINEMCNYITACCCHLENWYFVTHKLFSLFSTSLNPFLSCFLVSVRRIFMNMQEKIIREKMKIIITQTLASLVSLHFFLRRWVVTEIVSRDDIHTQQLWKLLSDDVLSVSNKRS